MKTGTTLLVTLCAISLLALGCGSSSGGAGSGADGTQAGTSDTLGSGAGGTDGTTGTNTSETTAGSGGLCNVQGKGYKCFATGCGADQWGAKALFGQTGGKDTVEIAIANSGGNNLDWTVSFTDYDDGGMPNWLVSLVVPKGTTSLTVTKFVKLGDLTAAIKQGTPVGVVTDFSNMKAEPPSGAVTLTLDAACGTAEIAWDLTTTGAKVLKGTSNLTRSACPPCE